MACPFGSALAVLSPHVPSHPSVLLGQVALGPALAVLASMIPVCMGPCEHTQGTCECYFQIYPELIPRLPIFLLSAHGPLQPHLGFQSHNFWYIPFKT